MPQNYDQPRANESSDAESLSRSLMNNNDKIESINARVQLLKEKGDACYNRGDHDSALVYYRNIFNDILGGRQPLSRSFYNEGYISALYADKKRAHKSYMFLKLISCCNNTVRIYRSRKDYLSALDWLEEIEILYDSLKIVYPEAHQMGSKKYDALEYITYHLNATLQFVHIFSDLQNTSSAAYFANLCAQTYPTIQPPNNPEVDEIARQCDVTPYLKMRHPNPMTTGTWDVKDITMQVRGLWSRINPQSSLRPTRRLHRNAWEWNKKLFVAFGVHEKNKSDCADDGDAWCISLENPEKWRRLPEIPRRMRHTITRAERVIVFNNQVWFFTGRLEILRFNMITETWDTVKTSARFAFPYKRSHSYDTYIERYGDKLCVLGGSSDYVTFKTRIFMLLDLKTLKWENLLANLTPVELSKMPSPRFSAITWVSLKENRFFLLYGSEVDQYEEDPISSNSRHMYDLWSYSFIEKSWTRERLRGNFPCHRMSTSFTYNEKQDKLVVFGGMTEDFPSLSMYSTNGETRDLQYTMLADTFVLDLKTRTWQQVVTRNYPAWRSSVTLMFDDDGGIFLYGGMSSRDVQLGTHDEARKDFPCFTDIWRLNITSTPPNLRLMKNYFSLRLQNLRLDAGDNVRRAKV